MRPTVLLLISVLVAMGCVERAPQLSPADRQRVADFISREPATPQHSLDVRFDNGIKLTGYNLEPATLTAGQPFTLTLYWHADQQLENGWQLFTHLANDGDPAVTNCDAPGQPCVRTAVVREVYQPMHWQPGENIRDVIEGTLPADWAGSRAIFYVGMWNGPSARLRVLTGPNDGENRVRVVAANVTPRPTAAADPLPPPRPQTPPPSLEASHTTAAITIDGNLDEADWTRTPRTGRFVSTIDGVAAPFAATTRMLWDEQNLYVAFEVGDDFLRNSLTERDAHLWEQDAVELMIDPDGDGRNYFELQVSPTGAIFDTRYDSRRVPQPVGHADWNAPMQVSVHTNGTVNDESPDQSYVVEAKIPFSAFATGEPPATAPSAGGSWRMNLYVMDARAAGQPQRSAGWSPTYEGDFHVPARFGRINFAAPPPPQQANTGGPLVAPHAISPQMAAAIREGMRMRQNPLNLPTPAERAAAEQGLNRPPPE